MKTATVVLLIAAVFCVFAAPAHADTIYTNLGAGQTYNANAGWIVNSPSSGLNSFAMPFVVPTGPGFDLTQLDLGVTFLGGTNDTATIELLTDSGGLPATIIPSATWTLNNMPAFGAAGSIQSSQTIPGISGITLSGGAQYWLAVIASGSNEFTWNYNNTSQSGPFAVSVTGGVNWAPESNNTLGAFDVLGTPIASTPEPSSLLLLGTGSLVLMGMTLLRKRLA